MLLFLSFFCPLRSGLAMGFIRFWRPAAVMGSRSRMRCRCVSDFPAAAFCGYVCRGRRRRRRGSCTLDEDLDGVNVGRSRLWEEGTTGPQNLGMVSNLRHWSKVCLGNAWGSSVGGGRLSALVEQNNPNLMIFSSSRALFVDYSDKPDSVPEQISHWLAPLLILLLPCRLPGRFEGLRDKQRLLDWLLRLALT